MEWLTKLKQHLLTGVSYAIPFVACGGILIAAALAFAPQGADHAPDPSGSKTLSFMFMVGVASFNLLLPILAAYISYSIAGKPGLVAGAIGGFLCNDINGHFIDPARPKVSAGFLGALLAGLLAGYAVQALKKIPTNKLTKPLMPILVLPIVSSLFVAAAMSLLLGPPIASLMASLSTHLTEMNSGNKVVLAMTLGAMIAFDMGGPVNKAAFFFASGLIASGNIQMMGAVAAAICTPPLGMGLATLIGGKLWSTEEKESGYAALGMGMIGITEGAIPFAASDPLRVIPSIMLGSMVASTVAMLGGVGDNAPHGGPIVLPVVENRLMYVVAIVSGMIVTAVTITVLKMLFKSPKQEQA
jgi:fructose-specific phosphotransferase system IIC component